MTSPAEYYRAALPAGEVEEFDLSALDRLGLPVWSVTLHPSHPDAGQSPGAAASPGAGGHGYGASADEARTGAFGELTEVTRSWSALAPLPRVEASYAQLRRERGTDRVADPRTLCLPAGTDYDDDRPLQWLPARRLRTGEEVLVPAELLASTPDDLPGPPPPGGWLTTVITNGLGAGLDRARAVSHALLELVQRDGNGLAFRAMDAGVVLDLDGLADPVSLDVLARLRAAGVEPMVKLASVEHGIPDVYAVGAGPDDDVAVMVTACGEAAHPDRERAVRKALLEFAAARTRKAFTHGPLAGVVAVTPEGYLDRYLASQPSERFGEERRSLDAMVAWLSLTTPELRALLAGSVLSHRSTVPLADLPTTAGLDEPAALLADLDARLAGFDVLVANLDGHPGRTAAETGVYAAKVVVPGLEVETMSYGRVGERGVRRLLDLGRDDLVRVGAATPGGSRVHLAAAAEERLGGPAWLDLAAVARVVGPLYPLYREPGRHAAPLAAGLTAGAAPA